MPDFRFFESRGPLTLAEVIALTSALAPAGVDVSHRVFGCASLEDADAQSAAFFADPRYKANLAKSAAGLIFLRANQAALAPSSAISLVVKSPQAAWARLAAALYRVRGFETVQPLDPSAMLEANVSLAPGAVVGPGVEIGRDTRIGANAVIGAGVKIGRGCDVGPGAVIQCALIGDRVRIGPNAVIGEAGFGVALDDGGPVDVPQLGRVILQDGVGVGASACIDRGALDDTVVGENTKIDNLVQIAHNVKIGRGCLLAAHTGLSGSVVVGDGAMFGGRAGVTDHNVIGAGAIIAAGAAVFRSVPAGETWSGYPARPLKRFLREVAWLAKATNGGSGRE